jgi:uncharacterized membrane protein
MATRAAEGQAAGGDPMRFHRKAHAEAGTDSENLYGDSFMERLAEKTASGMGTVQFVVIGSAIIVAWVLINNAIPYAEETIKHLAKGKPFDPVPWILLNLIFSGVAFYTGALVIIAQKAEGKKNNVREEADAKHREELAGSQTELLQKNTELTEQIHTLTQTMNRLTQEVHAATCHGPQLPAP